MAMKNPVHPGAILREDCLAPLGLPVVESLRLNPGDLARHADGIRFGDE